MLLENCVGVCIHVCVCVCTCMCACVHVCACTGAVGREGGSLGTGRDRNPSPSLPAHAFMLLSVERQPCSSGNLAHMLQEGDSAVMVPEEEGGAGTHAHSLIRDLLEDEVVQQGQLLCNLQG